MSENLIGATTAIFPIRLSVAVASPVDVEWVTRDGSAIAGSDYKAASGTVTFLPGETEKQIEVQVYGQAITPADDKVFFIRLNPPSNAVLVDAILTCTINIIDDHGIPSVAVVVAEGRRGPKGDPGISAYDQAVLMGYTGTLAEWMDQIADASKAADRAVDHAVSAAEDALKAQNAAKNAVFAGVVFPTAAEGVDPILGVMNGAYFNVRSPLSEHYIDEYQNVNSVAVATGKSYPTSDHFQNISEHTALPFVDSTSYKLNQRVVLANGDIVKSTIDGNTNDPNVDMAGWEKPQARDVFDENGKTQQEVNDEQDEKNIEFSDKLLRAQSLADIGYPRQALGYNTVSDAEIYNAQAKIPDRSLLMNGSLHLAKKYRGIRRNMDVLGLRGGRSSVSDGSDFNDQIVGVSNSRGLAGYGMNDGVTLFVDAKLPPLEEWETVSSATYTANTASIDPTTYANTLLNMKIGDVIQTMHTTKCWGIVQSIDKTTGLITVDEWATNGTTVVTPSNSTGFYVNLINKVWGINVNTEIRPNASGNVGGVIGEFGLIVAKDVPLKNGLDVVLLGGSLYNGDAAYLARSGTSGYRWLYGYMAQGNSFNYYSRDGKDNTQYAGFFDNSSAAVGMKFRRSAGTYSMLWNTSESDADISIENSPAIIANNGTLLRQPKSVQVLSASGNASVLKTTYLVSAVGVTVTLPPKAHHVTGHWYEFVLIGIGSYSFSGNGTLINGVGTYTFSTTETYVKYTVIYDGTGWIMYKG